MRDNRINGALNVSRTIGDLDFKRNDELPHTEQMVSAQCSVRVEREQRHRQWHREATSRCCMPCACSLTTAAPGYPPTPPHPDRSWRPPTLSSLC